MVALNAKEAKTTKNETTGRAGGSGGGNQYKPHGGGGGGKRQRYWGRDSGRGDRDHNGGRAPASSIPNPDKLWTSSVCSTVGN